MKRLRRTLKAELLKAACDDVLSSIDGQADCYCELYEHAGVYEEPRGSDPYNEWLKAEVRRRLCGTKRATSAPVAALERLNAILKKHKPLRVRALRQKDQANG